MDGFRVMPMAEAAKLGDIFCYRHRQQNLSSLASTSKK